MSKSCTMATEEKLFEDEFTRLSQGYGQLCEEQILEQNNYTVQTNEAGYEYSLEDIDLSSQELSGQALVAFFNGDDVILSTDSSDIQGTQQLTPTGTMLMSSLPIPQIGIPSQDSWPGRNDFQINFEQQNEEKISKTTDWTYSPFLQKLYISLGKSVPIRFATTGRLPENCVLRATPHFTDAADRLKVVARCLNHSAPNDKFNVNHVAPNHLIRTTFEPAEYQTEERSGRLSVALYFPKYQPGSSHIIVPYSFMCLSTCTGGIDRRPISVTFTLEHNGVVIGRQIVKVKICAAPGRDRKAEESKCGHPVATLPARKKKNLKRKNDGDDKGENKTYTITLKSRKNYELLKPLAVALESGDMMAVAASIPAVGNKKRKSSERKMSTKLRREHKEERISVKVKEEAF